MLSAFIFGLIGVGAVSLQEPQGIVATTFDASLPAGATRAEVSEVLSERITRAAISGRALRGPSPDQIRIELSFGIEPGRRIDWLLAPGDFSVHHALAGQGETCPDPVGAGRVCLPTPGGPVLVDRLALAGNASVIHAYTVPTPEDAPGVEVVLDAATQAQICAAMSDHPDSRLAYVLDGAVVGMSSMQGLDCTTAHLVTSLEEWKEADMLAAVIAAPRLPGAIIPTSPVFPPQDQTTRRTRARPVS